jgi:hypothetical protein
MPKARIVVIATVAAVLVVAGALVFSFGVTGKRSSTSTLKKVSANELALPSLNPGGVEIRGASARDRALLERLLEALPADEIKAISFRHNHERGKRQLVFSGPATTRAEWESEVLGSFFVLRFRSAKLGEIPVADLVAIGSAGPPDLQPIRVHAMQSNALRQTIDEALAGTHAHVVALKVFEPLGSLPAVIVEAPDPAKFARRSLERLRSLLGGAVGGEGYYLLVLNSRKEKVLEEEFANRLGTGATEEPPATQSCDPAVPKSFKTRLKLASCPVG